MKGNEAVEEVRCNEQHPGVQKIRPCWYPAGHTTPHSWETLFCSQCGARLRWRCSEGECHDRNHAGLARVMMNAMGRIRSLSDGTLGQDVAATAFAYERWLDERITPTAAEIEAALRAVPEKCSLCGSTEWETVCHLPSGDITTSYHSRHPDYPALARAVLALLEGTR